MITKQYYRMAAVCFIVAVANPLRLFFAYHSIPSWQAPLFVSGVVFAMTTSLVTAFLLLKIAKNIRSEIDLRRSVIASRIMILFVPLGFVFGWYSLSLLEAEKNGKTQRKGHS